MIDYVAVFTNTNSLAFPDTLTVNASGPSTDDGTELVKLFGDDIWGARQAVMDYAGLIPDGVSEAPGTSQLVEALQLGFGGSPGFVQEWNLASDPGTTGHRCLFLQGQGILRANYVALDDAVYVGDGNNAAVAAGGGFYYRADDAAGTTPNIAGIYLILPDRRGVVGRGLDVAASIDPDGASRFLGDLQIDAMQKITGEMEAALHAGDAVSLLGSHTGALTSGASTSHLYPTSLSGPVSLASITTFDSSASVSPNAAKTDDVETRMYNASTHFVIWY